jgi:hypothetical protein
LLIFLGSPGNRWMRLSHSWGALCLIQTISRDNPLWGAPRIHSELLKLGIHISQASVAKYMVRRPDPPSQTYQATNVWVEDSRKSDIIHFKLAGRMAGKITMFCQVFDSIKLFNSRWGYIWELNPGSIPIFACFTQCYQAFGVPSRHSIRWIAIGKCNGRT